MSQLTNPPPRGPLRQNESLSLARVPPQPCTSEPGPFQPQPFMVISSRKAPPPQLALRWERAALPGPGKAPMTSSLDGAEAKIQSQVPAAARDPAAAGGQQPRRKKTRSDFGFRREW